jgi:hypothetical protein
MITLILCGFFLCTLNLTLFPHCQFFTFVSTQFGRTIKAVQCDNGHEFDNASSRAFFAPSGVVLWMSYPYTSLQNDKAECSLCTINNVQCFLLFQASMLARYWVEALHTATYLLNCLPCKAISASCLYVALYRVVPSYEHLRIFGCVCYSNLSAQAAHKLPPHLLIVYFSNTPLITRAIGVSISPPTTSLSPDMLFLMIQSFPSLPRSV